MTTTYQIRKLLRLEGFDYSQGGAYFVTICAYNKKCIFGHIVDAHMRLNDLGMLVNDVWKQLPKTYLFVSLDNWVIMPNHLHGIIWLKEDCPEKTNLSVIISSFKANSTLQARKGLHQRVNLWQRGFYEHIIRNENDLLRIRQYIEDNPVQWAFDQENPDFVDTYTRTCRSEAC